ncbi:BMP family lipoprotein [Anaerosacchariphilus polymeriproducens]|uniref:BMP family ABC transporter substrate-binding protein n=1 Tax=Anaerosacchariphilus polymeriproducens TaxID=1812858 RepID=A0A371AVW4_9FIRM|nr:BMP family ABC transporter substrate-binding protein [Anaerosacchariphilus polymeriproducens]RDU23717.1 BMP family ABC transporter substrate-binding protein [Anaerosacchariphilus polymeriproducens]
MKKRLLSLLLAGVMATTMVAGCAKKPGAEGGEKGASEKGYELALITDVGTIDDKSFNQGSWEGLETYAKDNGITCKYYKPAEKSDSACLTSIDLAVKGGAKVIVTPGFLFEAPIYQAQEKYPDIKFIMVDAAPISPEKEVKINDNVSSVFYAEEQSGFLAGYAAVVEGYTKLGFMGGIAVPAVIRFGYGFVQGAEAAAKDLNISGVEVKYTYVGNFDATPENNAKAAAWYNNGTEVIFACGGAVGNSVMKAAEAAGKKVIGVDVDQSAESETVMTSAMKSLSTSVYDTVASVYKDSFQGGKSVTLTAKENGVLLPMETSKFNKFDQTKYDELYKGLQDGTIKVGNDTIATDASKLSSDYVKVESIK